jgi:hypothetical protein
MFAKALLFDFIDAFMLICHRSIIPHKSIDKIKKETFLKNLTIGVKIKKQEYLRHLKK